MNGDLTTYTYYDNGQVHNVTTPDPDLTRTGPGYDLQTTTYLGTVFHEAIH